VAEPTAPPTQTPRQVRLFASDAERRRQLRVINARKPLGLHDLYHVLLRTSWTRVFVFAALSYLAINAIFGAAYALVGGVSNARAGNYLDCFFFSVQTFGTIGYGTMYPESTAAEVLVTIEAFVSLFINAVVTGLAFAKFARPTARVLWTNKAVISDRDGIPTLMFRVANERLNHVVEATIRAGLIRAEVTREGELLRRVLDLHLVRSSTPTFILTWTVMHQITRDSPFYGMTPQKLATTQTEVVLTLTGLDETLGQTINARTSFIAADVLFGHRFGDIITADAIGRVLDYARFDDTRPAPLTWAAMGVSEEELKGS
jgi:inward rectifier potassium channel